MAYWHKKDANEEELPAFINDYGQTISVGDKVHYPTWQAGFSSGIVKKIVAFDAETWDFKQKKSVPCRKHNVYVYRDVEVWTHKKGEIDKQWQVRTFKVYHAHRIVKLYPDEVF